MSGNGARDIPAEPMDADAFVAWAMATEGHYELLRGRVVPVAPASIGYVRTKGALLEALVRREEAMAGPDGWEAMLGMAVLVDTTTVVEPAALIRPGPRLRGDAVFVEDPLAVFEILGPGPARPDIAGKLLDYARLPTLRHLVVIDSVRRAVAHHRREEDNRFTVEILRRGELVLDPPGFGIPLAPLFRD